MASLQSSNHDLTGVFWDFLVFGMILLLSAIDINSFIKTSKLDRWHFTSFALEVLP